MKIVRARKDMIHRLHGLHGCERSRGRPSGPGKDGSGIEFEEPRSVIGVIRGRNILARDERTGCRRDLRELASLTSTADGAQRLAWGPVWRDARQWFNGKLATLGITPEIDAAGNSWATLKGASDRTVIIGSHLDSVPNGGWLDGALGVMAGLEALRMFAGQQPPVTIKVVDWADEEGARFGSSLLGSSAASGSLQVAEVEHLADKTGVRLVDALARERRRAVAHARIATIPEGDQREGLSRAAHRTRAGARVDEQIDRRRARHVRRRAPPVAIRRPGRALGLDANSDAPRCVPGRRGKRARLPRDRPQATPRRQPEWSARSAR